MVALRGSSLRFRVVAVFRVIPEHPTGLADDDATTTTRNTKPASYAPARPVPRVRLVCGYHGGAVILAVGHVAFMSCATPRGAGTNLNDSDAAAWWFVCLYLWRTKRHGVVFEWFHDGTKHPASAPRAEGQLALVR